MPVFLLNNELLFPPPGLARGDGLLAVGGDLSEPRLLLAYKMGIFPWYSPGEPILWWAPAPRLIIEPREFHISKRLARTIRKGVFNISMDKAFREVIEACARSRSEKGEETWIDDKMIAAYCRLHASGYARSVECWRDGILVGGLYGVSLGTVFFGESMFSMVPDSSKVALAALVKRLIGWGFDLIDCQVETGHLLRMGAKMIPGVVFYQWLNDSVRRPSCLGKWKP